MMGDAIGASTIDLDAVEQRLVDAIQDGQLREVLVRLNAESSRLTDTAREMVAHASTAVATIDAAVVTERARITEQLAARGVTPESSINAFAARPLHIVSLTVAPHEADRATDALAICGYRRLAPTAPAAWRAYRATRGACTFVRPDRDPFRVELTWSLRPLSTRGTLGKLLTPQPSDFDAVTLPATLWPAFTLVRLLRLPARRWRRQHEPLDLGPFLQTPSALIAPLLRFAHLSAGDLLIDLGCGDGRIAIAAAALTGCRARGVETNPELVARARAAAAEANVAHLVDIQHADASSVALRDADVVVAFLPVTTIEQLLPSVLTRMKAGARFVAHEQERLRGRPAEARVPLLSAEGITVAHRWRS